jgi:hypothetical protein
MIHSRQPIAWPCAWLGLLLIVTGCGPAKTEVSGTVRYQGKPLTSGNVLVVDADGMTYAAPIRSEGSYTARDIPVGPVRFAVLVSSKHENGGKLLKREPRERRRQSTSLTRRQSSSPPPKPLLPPRYAAVGTSGLSTILSPGANTFDLDLD